MKADGKFISCVGLQISHQNVLLIPADKSFNHPELSRLASHASHAFQCIINIKLGSLFVMLILGDPHDKTGFRNLFLIIRNCPAGGARVHRAEPQLKTT